jgi:hypothetical protein
LSKIKVLLLGSLTALGIVGATAGTASAAQTLACPNFQGSTDTLTPPVQFLGGTGTYSFHGPATCSLNGSTPAANNSTITSTGSYSNIVCGTGTATGSADIKVGTATAVHLTYTIQFVGGLGAITGTGTSTGGGPVSIRPSLTNAANPPGDCVTQFDVVGAFAGTAP